MMRQQQGIYGEDDESNMEWGRGYVSKEQKEREQRKKQTDVGRGYTGQTKDDSDLNEEWKSKERWADPMAGLLVRVMNGT